jgi:hypothetical protein
MLENTGECVKRIGPESVGLFGGGRTFKRQGLLEGLQVTGDVPLKRSVGSQPLYLLFASQL